MGKRRSIGITTCGIVMILFSFFNSVNIFRFHLLSPSSTSAHKTGGVIGLVLGILLLIAAAYLLRLKNWGRKFAIMILGIHSSYLVIISYSFLVRLIRSHNFSPWTFLKLIEFIVYIAIILYLTRLKVRSEFR